MFEIIPSGTQIDFIGRARLWVAISLILIGVGVAAMVVRGLNLGIDFRGGTVVQIQTNEPVPIQEIRDALTAAGHGDAVIQEFGSPKDILIRIQTGEGNVVKEVKQALSERFEKQGLKVLRQEEVGPQVGSDLRHKAVMAILYALGMVVIYITVRFEFKYALGAILALVHDVLLTLGAFAVTQLEVDLTVVAAVLTIVGYSLNDTIVVYDRIRENHLANVQEPIVPVINRSVNETLSRTILTSATTLVVVVALFFLGGEVIHDFAFALLVGIVVGTYSSIFIASPVVVAWDRLVRKEAVEEADAPAR